MKVDITLETTGDSTKECVESSATRLDADTEGIIGLCLTTDACVRIREEEAASCRLGCVLLDVDAVSCALFSDPARVGLGVEEEGAATDV